LFVNTRLDEIPGGYAPLYSYCRSLRAEISTERIVSRASKMAASIAVEKMVSIEKEKRINSKRIPPGIRYRTGRIVEAESVPVKK
jgi:hypothetical protein